MKIYNGTVTLEDSLTVPLEVNFLINNISLDLDDIASYFLVI